MEHRKVIEVKKQFNLLMLDWTWAVVEATVYEIEKVLQNESETV